MWFTFQYCYNDFGGKNLLKCKLRDVFNKNVTDLQTKMHIKIDFFKVDINNVLNMWYSYQGLEKFVNSLVLTVCAKEALVIFLKIALFCTSTSLLNRPTMREVIAMLIDAREYVSKSPTSPTSESPLDEDDDISSKG